MRASEKNPAQFCDVSLSHAIPPPCGARATHLFSSKVVRDTMSRLKLPLENTAKMVTQSRCAGSIACSLFVCSLFLPGVVLAQKTSPEKQVASPAAQATPKETAEPEKNEDPNF